MAYLSTLQRKKKKIIARNHVIKKTDTLNYEQLSLKSQILSSAELSIWGFHPRKRVIFGAQPPPPPPLGPGLVKTLVSKEFPASSPYLTKY